MTRTSKTQLLAAERQEPYTAAEHAEAEGHAWEFTRDVPRTCICTWQWSPLGRLYARVAVNPECPWCSVPGSA